MQANTVFCFNHEQPRNYESCLFKNQHDWEQVTSTMRVNHCSNKTTTFTIVTWLTCEATASRLFCPRASK